VSGSARRLAADFSNLDGRSDILGNEFAYMLGQQPLHELRINRFKLEKQIGQLI
jgi:hypothetical protein